MAFADVSLRIALAATFLLAAGSKVYRQRAWRSFRSTIRSVGLVPAKAGAVVAAAVAGAESATALLLLVDPRGVYGPAACIVLLAAFSGVIARSIVRKDGTSCRCFGRSTEPMGAVHLWRNLILLAMAVFALVLAVTGRPAAEAEMVAVAIPVGIFWAVVLASFTEFTSLLQPQSATRSADSR